MEYPPKVTVVLLGNAGCGKSTFLSRISRGQSTLSSDFSDKFKLLEDIDQPFVHDVQLYRRPYRFEFYDTASPESYALLQPSVVVLCFDINDRLSLFNAKDVWHKVAARNYREAIPLVLLGLKRDLRADASNMISPQEAIQVAQEIRCDRYAECSATTGELISQVYEDIAILGAKTTTRVGALSEPTCIVS